MYATILDEPQIGLWVGRLELLHYMCGISELPVNAMPSSIGENANEEDGTR